ncbi:hypothetical protein RIR_jg29850.t1 [Rhizophagus irregularis DAOM 181602=DAOM 197198]|nr:hypothetical protein RIR_jg29850.t1 [Rhizophagus irregularis DAOM 181602=DAOM 197198]
MAQQKSGTAYQTIFPVITQKKLSNQFLVYRVYGNIMKIKYIGSKLINIGKVLSGEIIFSIVCAGGMI